MKIILGTANFGQKYGLNNNKLTKNQAKQILSVSRKNNIKQVDTAIDYGNTETILGDIGVDNLKICTKLPNIPKNLKKNKLKNGFLIRYSVH
jgi:aryl-alcohol dehydrogenase-like predicted oxidoreductase